MRSPPSIAFEHGKFGHVSWWDYHGYLMAGFGGAVYAVFRRRGDERTLTEVLNGAFVDDPFEHIVSGYPEALRSLVRAVEVKDTYTHGHSQRTARMAVELGLSMGLGARPAACHRPRRLPARRRQDRDPGQRSSTSPTS